VSVVRLYTITFSRDVGMYSKCHDLVWMLARLLGKVGKQKILERIRIALIF
jgi:hypothetical protein